MKPKHRSAPAGLVALLLAGTSLSQIAPAETPPAPVAASDAGLGEIVVTAQRRKERLQDVPIAVSSLNTEALKDNDVRTLQDLSARVPGFVATETVGYGSATLSIRGVGGSNGGGNFFADEPVATYIDNVYIGRLSVASNDIVDVEDIQILRGPQGTLYGRNSTAGALVINTARPTEEFSGHEDLSFTNLGDVRSETVLSGPIIPDKLLGRIAYAYSHKGGFGTNVNDSETPNSGQDVTIRGSLRFLPIDDVTIDLIGEHFDQHFQPGLFRIAQVTGGQHDSPFVLRPDFQQAIDNSSYAYVGPNYNYITTDSATVLGEWRLPFVTLNSVSAFRSYDVNGRADSVDTNPSNLVVPLTGYNSAVLRNRQLSQEFRVASPGNDSPFKWTAGAFYFHENNEVNPFIISNSIAYFNLGTNAFFRASQRLNAAAAFADGSYEILDGLTLTLGGRYSFEEKVFQVNQTVVTILPGFSPAVRAVVPAGFIVAAPPTFHAQKNFYNFSDRAVLDYKLTKDVSTYFNYSQGFKSGGFNAFGLAPAFQPEKNDAYELGVKSEFMDRTLRVNADIFMYDYSNLQVRLPVPNGGVNIANVGAAVVRGAELDTVYKPLPPLKLGLTVTRLDAHFTQGALPEVPDNATFQFGANIPLTTVSIVNNSLSRAPKWQINLTADYSMDVTDELEATAGMSFRASSNEFYLETNQDTPTYRSGSWSELGLHVTLTPASDNWSATIYGENILDDRHVTQILSLRAFPYGSLNEPARCGARLSYRF